MVSKHQSLTQSGQDRYSTEVVLRPYSGTLTLLDSAGGGGGSNQGDYGGGNQGNNQGGDYQSPNYGGSPSPSVGPSMDDEIPF